MTESRKQFEEWFKQSHTENVQKVDGEYVHGATERLWQAWQASRAALVVKLPDAEGWTDDGTYSFSVDLRDAQHALDDAGVSYE